METEDHKYFFKGHLDLFLSVLEFLDIPEKPEVRDNLQSYRKLLEHLSADTTFHLLRLKLKALIKMRDQALLNQSSSQPPSDHLPLPPTDFREPVNRVLEHSLDALEQASESTNRYAGRIRSGIHQMETARQEAVWEHAAKNMLSESLDMLSETEKFGSSIGDVAGLILEYQRRILFLEDEVEEQRQLANTDPLTKVLNRGAFDQRIKVALKDYKRFKRPLCMLIADLDHFKDINDRYGHQVGDDVLVNFAGLLRKTLRDNDIIFRYGGDEFIVLFQNVSLPMAVDICERMRQFTQKNAYRYKDLKFHTYFTGGLTMADPEDDVDTFFKRADHLLYKAKEAGRNRIIAGS